jgi:hypothetical protein
MQHAIQYSGMGGGYGTEQTANAPFLRCIAMVRTHLIRSMLRPMCLFLSTSVQNGLPSITKDANFFSALCM